MAVRSGAGTGVVVSLVVFVLTTVFLLVLTIVFYSMKTDEAQARADVESQLTAYATQPERSSDKYKRFEQSSGRDSVAEHLNKKYEDLARYLLGSAPGTVDEIKAELSQFGVSADVGGVRAAIEQFRREGREKDDEIGRLRAQLGDREAELTEKDAQNQQLMTAHALEIETIGREFNEYQDAAEEYRDDVQDTIEEMRRSVDRLNDDYESRIADLEDEIDEFNRRAIVLTGRLKEYESRFAEIRRKAANPAELVDGEIIDTEPANDQVFINRGRKDRIVLGMTFEVYDDSNLIRTDPATGFFSRGKASIQVVKVGESTSTCKIIRSVSGRPAIRNDVIANAIYDPEYAFGFLVHGKFDVDQDGKPTEAEADYLRALVKDWGGTVEYGEELPGDLDFLVLGMMPPQPSPLPPDATPIQIEIWAKQRGEREKYLRLFNQASEAQIPVLNANRFFILIGRPDG